MKGRIIKDQGRFVRYLIGALFGIAIFLAFIGVWYMGFFAKQSMIPVSSSQPSTPSSVTSPQANTTKPYQNKPTYIKQYNKPEQRTLYQWTDENGQTILADRPNSNGPSTIRYVGTVKPKETKRHRSTNKTNKKHVKTTRNNSNKSSRYNGEHIKPDWKIKQELLDKNTSAHCRILAGRTYDLLKRIEAHSGSRKSIWCENYYDRIKEMRDLARKGDSCHYPFSTPAKCYN